MISATYETYLSAVNEALAAQPMLQGTPKTCFTPADILASAVAQLPPEPLRSAMRYSLLIGGKRVRPVLLLMSYSLLRDDWHQALPFACALEMIHTYSLIHDDLPALDNDALRRGQPTNHKVFGEDMAILGGDGLLNMAFETMLNSEFCAQDSASAVRAMREIANRCGVCGMIAGQTLDVTLEGTKPSREAVRYIHLHKTADLLTAPVTAGLMLAGADDQQIAAGERYGQNLGLCFQIVDDLLDLRGDSAKLGKQTHMDEERGKMTWPTVCGIEQSDRDAHAASAAAIEALVSFGERAEPMRRMAADLLSRDF